MLFFNFKGFFKVSILMKGVGTNFSCLSIRPLKGPYKSGTMHKCHKRCLNTKNKDVSKWKQMASIKDLSRFQFQ